MDLVCFGQQNWDYCWTGKQQLLTRLAPRGWRILYVNPDAPGERLPPLESAHALAGTHPSSSEKQPWGDLWVHTPRTLCLGWRWSRSLDRRQLDAALRHLGFTRPLVLALQPLPPERIAALAPLGVVYYAVDEFTGFGGMSEDERVDVRALEVALAARADLCLGISSRLVERLRQINPATFLQEGGADVDHFAPARLERFSTHPALADVKGPVLGFIGQVDDRLDQALLQAIARARPQWTIVLAGRRKPGVDFSRLEACANIRMIGYQPYDELPRVARHVDVWLVPYVRNDLTQSCNPLKVFEYLATGKPCVSVPLDGLGACRDAVVLAADAESFVAAIAAALATPARGRRQRLAAARTNDWDIRVDALEGHLRRAAATTAAARGVPLAADRQISAAQARRRLAGSPAINEYGQPLDYPRLWWVDTVGRSAARLAGMAFRLGRVLTGGPTGVRRVLLVRHSRLGDLVAITPTLAALRRAFPTARIDLGIDKDASTAALALSTGLVDEVRTLNFVWEGTWRQRLAGFLRLLFAGYDVTVCGSKWFFLPEALLAGSPRFAGILDGHPMQAVTGMVLPRDYGRHEADNNLDLIEALTRCGMDDLRQPHLPVDQTLVARRDAELAALLPPPERPFLMVHPGANRSSRRWPEELLAVAVARVLERHRDVAVVFTGIDDEQALVARVESLLPSALTQRVYNLVGQTDAFGLLALLDRAQVLLCNDTGIMHMARARGTPLVATLGPENDRLWGPYPQGPAPATTLRVEVPCAPCARLSCDALFCLRSIDPERVAAEVSALLIADRRPAQGSPVVRHLRRAGWSDLVRAGHSLPLVSVVHVLEPGQAGAVADVVAAVERQLYPAVEIVVVDRAGAGWDDERDEKARSALPVHVVSAANATGVWPAAVAAAKGTLLLRHRPDTRWWPGKLAAGVAAAMRVPSAQAFTDDTPLPRIDAALLDIAMLRRAAVAVHLGTAGSLGAPLAGRHAAE